MEKPGIASISYIKSSIDNIKQNSDINLRMIGDLISLMDNASRRVVLPIIKIQKKLRVLMTHYVAAYSEMKTKAEESLIQLEGLKEDAKGTTMTLSSLALNRSKADEHGKLVELFEIVTNSIELIAELGKTTEYNKILSTFNLLTTEEDLQGDQIDEVNQLEKEVKLKKIKLKKKKVPKVLAPGKLSGKEGKATATLSKKEKKEKAKASDKADDKSKDDDSSHINKAKKLKGKADMELLDLIQKEYPTTIYIQKLSRTFLRRRLFKKVIYLNQFSFNPSTQLPTEEKLKSSGDSTIYKYGKFTFDFATQLQQKQYSAFISFFEAYFKHSFVQSEPPLKTIIIAGKVNLALTDLLDQVFREGGIYKEHNVHFVKVEFYEFYEELASEFNPKEKTVKVNCEEKVLRQLAEDWKGLLLVREFVEKHRMNEEGNDIAEG